MPNASYRTCEEVTLERRQLWANGHRPLGVRTNGKEPVGMNWNGRARENPPFAAINPAQTWELNTGLLCDGLRAVDIDVDDPARANSLRELAFNTLGSAPARWRRNSHRLLLLYRAAEGAPKKRSIVSAVFKSADGKAEKVEVLGYGQQFVAYGVHPSGDTLEWYPQGPLQIPFANLPSVTEDQITAFVVEAAKIIGAPVEDARAQVGVGGPSHGVAPNALPHGPVDDRNRSYAAKTLRIVAAELAGLRSERNRACNAIGYKMGRLVGGGCIERATVEDALYAAMLTNGWREDNPHRDKKAWASLQSGLTKGILNPRVPFPPSPDTSNWKDEWEALKARKGFASGGVNRG